MRIQSVVLLAALSLANCDGEPDVVRCVQGEQDVCPCAAGTWGVQRCEEGAFGDCACIEAGASCVPGAQVSCACPGGEEGVQVCAEDGESFEPCQCGGAGGTGGGEAGNGGAGGSTTSSTSSGGAGPVDEDGDGFSTAGDCDDSDPAVNPDAFEALGDGVDNDCNGTKDVAPPSCDGPLAIDSALGTDGLRALGICNEAWIVSAEYQQANGDGVPGPPEWLAYVTDNFHLGHGILDGLGSYYTPREGARVLVLSTGIARKPDFQGWDPDKSKGYNSEAPVGEPVCGGPTVTGKPHDSIQLTAVLRVPPNAKGFTFNHAHLSWLLPDFTCGASQDVFRFLLGTTNAVRCTDGEAFTPSCGAFFNAATSALVGTGYDSHGGTAWLRTEAPAVPGEELTISFGVWDSEHGGSDFESVLDRFQWSAKAILSTTTAMQP